MLNILQFLAGVLTLISIYTVLTLSVNLHYGYGGLDSFGIVGFMALGAYTYTILTIGPAVGDNVYLFGYNFPWWFAFLAAGAVTVIFAFIIGLPTLRVAGDYLLIVTFAFAEIIQKLLSNEGWLTNGTRGFIRVYQPFSDVIPGHYYKFFLAGLVITIVVIFYLIAQHVGASPFGRTMRAIRDNEPVALSVGKNAYFFKMRIFLLGAAMIGMAGAMYTWYMTIAVPPLFGMEVTFAAWIALVIGGLGNNKGAVVGTIVLLGAQQALKFIQLTPDLAPMISSIQMIIEGLVLVLILRFWPKGLIPEKSPKSPNLPRNKVVTMHVEALPTKEGA
jgi:branched-chain amino acid transport system permease protein